MANRFVLPLETPVDATGAPYPGGKLFFYASGTSTKLDTYSNSSLTIANSNPVELDSAGRFPNAIFLQNAAYKVVFAPADDTDPPTSPIWTQDPVYTSDYSTAAQFASGSGSPNGSVAGTAGSATIKASSYWDYTNEILYICTTTGSTTTAVWTAINAATTEAFVPSPQGYITPVSNTPIITGDSVAATTIYYTPYVGDSVPIYNGTTILPVSIVTELQLTLTSSHVASNIYDLYVFSLNGVPTFGSGPSWSAGTGGSITAGSCARGTGAGGAALSRVQGLLTNAVSMTIRYGNGTTTTTVDPNQATYVGSMFMDGTNGQVSCYRSYGQNRKWGLWNAYNRVPIKLIAGDATASWTSSTTGWRASDNNSANNATVFCGLAEEWTTATFNQNITPAGNNRYGYIGIGLNSTSSPSGYYDLIASNLSVGLNYPMSANCSIAPALGINVLQQLENTVVADMTYNGTNASMVMNVNWRG